MNKYIFQQKLEKLIDSNLLLTNDADEVERFTFKKWGYLLVGKKEIKDAIDYFSIQTSGLNAVIGDVATGKELNFSITPKKLIQNSVAEAWDCGTQEQFIKNAKTFSKMLLRAAIKMENQLK